MMKKLLTIGIVQTLSFLTFTAMSQSSSTKYQLVGSYHQMDNNFYYDMPDEQYTFETLGSVFFKVRDTENNIYYGSAISEDESGNNKNYTALAGSYPAVSSEDVSSVGSLYFTMSEGFTYTVKVQESTDNTDNPVLIVSLTVEPVKDGNFDIEAKTDYSHGMFMPKLLSQDGLEDATVASVTVTSYDFPAMSEVFSQVFRWTSPPDETFTLDKWDAIIATANPTQDEDGKSWISDPIEYTDDIYCYQLEVKMQTPDGKYHRFVVNSNSFPINSEGNPLIIRGYYLVQIGDGTSEYYTFSADENATVYNVNNLNGTLGNSGNILFNKANIGDEKIDYGDENTYKFTDQVLIRSNKPYGISSDKIQMFELYNVTDPNNETLLVDSKSNPNSYNNDEGRFMAIVECQIQKQEYKLVMTYYDKNNALQELEAFVKIAVSIPSPKIDTSYVQFYKGTDESEDTDNATLSTFTFPALTGSRGNFVLRDARYHNLRQYVRLIKPNTTEVLGHKMLDTNSGSFSYFYKCFNGEEEVNRVNLRFQSNDDSDEHKVIWETAGPLVIPDELLDPEQEGKYDSRCLAYSHTFPTYVYDRWGDGSLSQINIDDERPESEKPAFIKNSNLYYEPTATGGRYNLKEDFIVTIQLDDTADSKCVSYNESDKGELFNKTANDYYYVVIIDTQKEGVDVDLDGPTKSDYIPDTGYRTYPEGIYTAEELRNGVQIPFTHRVTTKNEMIWDDDVTEAFQNPYCERLQLRIHYLYPFRTFSNSEATADFTEGENEIAALRNSVRSIDGPSANVPSNLHGNVIMSKPLIYNLEAGSVTTGVDKVSSDSPVTITAGTGYVKIIGANGRILTLDGRQIAEGSGYIPVPKGLYIVSAGHEIQKVIVK